MHPSSLQLKAGRRSKQMTHRFRIPCRFVRTALTLAAAVFLLAIAGTAGADRIDRHIERPAGHSKLGWQSAATTSYIQRTLLFPATLPRLEFDYFVESEANYDFLKVYVDGLLKLSVSGRNRSGHAYLAVGSGARLVRFEYVKDTSVDSGLDTAWVDNIATGAGSAADRFKQRDLYAPPSPWTVGGHSGGWTVSTKPVGMSIGRPRAQSFLGYQQQPSTSRIQRSAYFATSGSITFRYYVDSEQGWDFFRAYLNGAKVFEVSGSNRAGLKRLEVPSGTHSIMFEYYKDTSVDAGLDTARVSEVVFRAGEDIIEADRFDGQAPGVTPSLWWTPSGTHPGWLVTRPSPPRMFLDGVDQATPIFVDGVIDMESASTKEYVNATGIVLPEYQNSRKAAQLNLRSSRSSEALHFAYLAASGTAAPGGETGYLTLVFDSNHSNTLKDRSPCIPASSPGAEDRAVTMIYESPVGQSAASLTATYWYVGDCSGTGWRAATPEEAWPIAFAAKEDPDHPGWLNMELKVTTRSAAAGVSDFWASQAIGFAFTHANAALGSYNYSFERLPWTDGDMWSPYDVTTWQTLHLGSPSLYPVDSRMDAVPSRLARIP
jgi:hypothetical protein